MSQILLFIPASILKCVFGLVERTLLCSISAVVCTENHSVFSFLWPLYIVQEFWWTSLKKTFLRKWWKKLTESMALFCCNNPHYTSDFIYWRIPGMLISAMDVQLFIKGARPTLKRAIIETWKTFGTSNAFFKQCSLTSGKLFFFLSVHSFLGNRFCFEYAN